MSQDTSHLHFICSFPLNPTKGRDTITRAKNVFTGFLCPDFEALDTDVLEIDTAETQVEVYELLKDGTYAEIFGSLETSANFTKGQITEFCEAHPDLLCGQGRTLFPFVDDGQRMVAIVKLDDAGQLDVIVHRLDDDYMRYAVDGYCVVVPLQ